MSKRVFTTFLACLLVLSISLSLAGCGGSDPKGVVNAFFDSIDKHDAKKFLNCFEEDVQESFEDIYEEDDLKDMLESIDELLEDEYGKKWRKEVKVTDVEKGDKEDDITYYTVTVEMDDEEEEMEVMKIKGKYYISDDAMSGFGGF